ncbi:hypothetical protein AAG570_008487 [Ranatra chinensis]|uniref:BZIP domain-containing protein n=1 Tax=Ranatra chinensis TaxID=642074 RepID=A0ABD0YR11_9HEMI
MTNPFDAMRVGPDSTSTSGSSVCSTSSPPSVQHTCSQLIKEGLKLTIQTKRKNNMSPALTDEPTAKPHHRSEEVRLLLTFVDSATNEDEERRRRRRERNKIAATKCRLKKRERTVNLVQESEILETQNHDLKSQIQELETERRQLIDMLSVHGRSCSKMPYTSVVSPAPYQECYTQQCNSSSSVETSPANYSAGYQSPYCKVIQISLH